MFIKNKTKVACRMSGIEWRVVCIRNLLFQTNDEKFSLRRVKSKKISRHPGGNLSQSGLEMGDTRVKVTRMEWEETLSVIGIQRKWWDECAEGSVPVALLSTVQFINCPACSSPCQSLASQANEWLISKLTTHWRVGYSSEAGWWTILPVCRPIAVYLLVCLSICLSLCVCTRRKLIDTICYIVRLFCVHTIKCFIDSAAFGFYVAKFTTVQGPFARRRHHMLLCLKPSNKRSKNVCRLQKCKAGNNIIIGVTTRIWE